jgi:hypothetical protein
VSGKRTLLVEGPDDEHVIKHICGNRHVPHLDVIKPSGGIEQLLESVPVHLKASEEGDIIGIVVDADTDLANRWQSLRDRLVRVGYAQIPVTPDPSGTIIIQPPASALPRTGIWIMPNNQTSGMLEDFLRFLVPARSSLFDHVTSSIASIPPPDLRFSLGIASKATIHTWLAWQEEPGKPLGTAITARYLDPNVPQVDQLVAWINQLFFANESISLTS